MLINIKMSINFDVHITMQWIVIDCVCCLTKLNILFSIVIQM